MPNWTDHKMAKPANDNEYFERMSRMIFNSGLNWRMIDKKWPGIKQAFLNFDINKVARFQEPEIEEVMMSPDVIHNLPKVRAIVANAKNFHVVQKEYRSFDMYLDHLNKEGGEDLLRSDISKRFKFMGPSTTVMFLFSVGQDLPKAHQQWLEMHNMSAHD